MTHWLICAQVAEQQRELLAAQERRLREAEAARVAEKRDRALAKARVALAHFERNYSMMNVGNLPLTVYRVTLGGAGCASVLVRGACVGDDEDIKYARHAVGLLRSKRSSSFAMDGFTGSTNGHFGTSYGGADKPKAWKRQLA